MSVTAEEQNSVLKVNTGEEVTEEDTSDNAKECIGKKDIQRIIDLGLGRGVDATNPAPWKNKTAFQVRPITLENIIGTEEGGCVQSYEREITKTSETQGQASASVTNPKTAVSIGVEAEYFQSSSSRYRVIGTKVVNRTISFKEHCYDDTIQLPPGNDTFELWLCRWILKIKGIEIGGQIGKLKRCQSKMRSLDRWDSTKELRSLERQRSDLDDNTELEGCLKETVKLAQIAIEKLSHVEEEEIAKYCKQFIEHFRITHYVSSIQLGASGYEVSAENSISRKLKIGGRIGVEKIAAGSGEGSHSRSRSNKSSDVHRIGVIEMKNNIPTVKRGSHKEAVVGIQVKPISDLVQTPELKAALQTALVEYTRREAGPFLIHCATATNDKNLYLAVKDTDLTVTVVEGKTKASKFYLKPSENPRHPKEFYICYYDVDLKEHKNIGFEDQVDESKNYTEPVPRYLQTTLSVFGTNPGPLQLGYVASDKESRLVLQSCVSPVSLSTWINGRELCYIQCARRKPKKGYIAIKLKDSSVKHPKYKTCCVSSKRNERKEDTHMLFQIVKTKETSVGQNMREAQPKTKFNAGPMPIGMDEVDGPGDTSTREHQLNARNPLRRQMPNAVYGRDDIDGPGYTEETDGSGDTDMREQQPRQTPDAAHGSLGGDTDGNDRISAQCSSY